MARSLPCPPLLLITDRTQVRGDLAAVVEAACAGGCRWVSMREKDLPEAGLAALFSRLRAVTAPYGAVLTLHGPAAQAQAVGADGVHLPAGSDAGAARALLGPGALIGLSVHGADEARTVQAGSVDYITASPVFLTRSKPGYGPALGPEGLQRFVLASPVPVLALGGVSIGTLAGCMEAGAQGVAVMGEMMRADQPRDMMAQLLSQLPPPQG